MSTIRILPDHSTYLNQRGVWFAYLTNGPRGSVIASNSLKGLQDKADRLRASGTAVEPHAYKVLADDHTEKFYNYI